jgi:tRNA-specific 2-thiouridylase
VFYACELAEINWVSVPAPQQPLELEVQVRYRSGPERALLTPLGPSTCRLDFAEEQFSITPGQGAVFYAGELLLGGGLIQR